MGRIFVIGLGSNLDQRERNLVRGVDGIVKVAPALESLSRVYESSALGPPQPDYLNAAVRVASELTPEALLDALHAIEAQLGRTRTVHWGPRQLDLDILWCNDRRSTDRLTIPHAQLFERTFALAPLLDVAPELRPSYGPVLERLGGPPSVRGFLSFDRSSFGDPACAYTASDVL